MKKIIICILCMLALAVSINVHGEASSSQENAAPNDSTIDVIGWFNKRDTVTYWVNRSSWNINGTDTVLTASISMKMRINVTDSTANGYKLDCTFLEFPVDTLPDSTSALARLQSQITAKLGQKIAGKTVHFETDDCGRITKYTNLGKIKKQAKSLFSEVIKGLSKLPKMKELKKTGFDIQDYAKKVDSDILVDGYLEELTMLFMNHGNSMKIGEFTEHEDATDAQFENTSYCSVSADDGGETYHIVCDVTNIVPQNELKAMVGGIVESFSNDSITDKFNNNFDKQVNVDGTYEDYVKTDYLANGWPYSIVRQRTTKIGDRKKSSRQ